MILHGYWRSSAAYRVRIALAWKGIDVTQPDRVARADEIGRAALIDQRVGPE